MILTVCRKLACPLRSIPLAFFFLATACAGLEVTEESTAHHPWDLEPLAEEGVEKADGFPAHFDQDWLLSDRFFTASKIISESRLQGFFEMTPYGIRSWLADTKINGRSIAWHIIRVAEEAELNPLLLVARMQVEQSLISSEQAPSKYRIDFAFGCGCPDDTGCQESYRGLERQLRCAAETMRGLFDKSVQREGLWRAGVSRETLDQILITPVNHATAALYAYTPWVLRGSGGGWLVWNITRKFSRALSEDEPFHFEEQSCLAGTERPFIGDPCGCQADCAFWAQGSPAFCHEAGLCVLPCEGFCPDLWGRARTFCVEDQSTFSSREPPRGGAGTGATHPGGICVPLAVEENGRCADLPGTLDLETDRFIGGSRAGEKRALACLPQ